MIEPHLVVGAPVAERAWILPRWFECLRQQTLQPREYCFVYSPGQDDTLEVLMALGERVQVHETKLPFHSRDQRNADPKDPHRAKHMAALRNRLRTLFMQTGADIFVSLDTDILLENPRVLEELVATIQTGRWDVAAALTHLHPLEARSGCYNAGIWWGGEPGAFDQGWMRCTENEALVYRSPVRIDIPMACYAIRRHAMGMCAYKAHDQGEDIGFAQSLTKHGFRVGWRTDLEVRHVWGPSYLTQEAVA